MSHYSRSRNGLLGAIVVLTLLTVGALTTTPALAAANEGCPNEAVRAQSNINPTTNEPYDFSLPECRAYEMVSPLEKQAHNTESYAGGGGLPVAPDGEAVGFASEGSFSEPTNTRVNAHPANTYLATRSPSGWLTRSAFAPANIVGAPFLNGLDADFSLDLQSDEVSCGYAAVDANNSGEGPGFVCATREPDGAWTSTPVYTTTNGARPANLATLSYLGASADLSRVLIQPTGNLLPSDTAAATGSAGIYEISGLNTPVPQLRLVNVDNSGNELFGEDHSGPMLGDWRAKPGVNGTSYHAISESGETVFFTATPAGGVQTVYARVHGSETIAVSDPSPSQCTRTETEPGGKCGPPAPATYQGASADGSKVFFTTDQQLVNEDTDSTDDLYEYDFDNTPGKQLVDISGGGLGDLSPGSGAEVQGVVRSSSDGSHVYFVALGVLTTVPNADGQAAKTGQPNLYGYDTNTNETKFVGELSSRDAALWGTVIGEQSNDNGTRDAQTTPDGQYLVFSTYAHLLPEDTNEAQAVYRYDFQTGELTWVSHPAPGFNSEDQERGSYIAPLPGNTAGAEADIDDWSRAISENGETVVFATAERLQADDTNGGSSASVCIGGVVGGETAGCDVYEWHDGTVGMVSDGQGEGSDLGAISASGGDIFFFTNTQLVKQDTDTLRDLYDARTDGGFPAPTPEPSCSGEACQGSQPTAPIFAAPSTARFTGGGNLLPPTTTAITGKVKITKHSVKAATITLTVQAPVKGKLTGSGSGVKTATKSVKGSGSYELKLKLNKAEQKKLKAKKKLTVKVEVAFKPVSGKSSTTSTSVTLKATVSKRTKTKR